ncbi:MAG: SOS response-associated peptidase [Opitutae bacterium]|nr:SOS response-associated peptidase [Opitutae bacterium]
MCVRYTLLGLAPEDFPEALAKAVGAAGAAWIPRYNVAPKQSMPVITRRDRPVLETMSFGFTLPARTPAEKPVLLVNARAQTLLDKPAFRDAAQHRRCLVPADGFYEWEKQGATRLPHYFALREGRLFFFAGLWQPGTDATPASFAIVTTGPNALLRPIHDRMPVILGPNSGPAWLGNEPLPPGRLARLCRPLPAEMMTRHRVDPRVNRVRYEAPDCIRPL